MRQSTSQFKQFMLSSAFALVAIGGVTLSNAFDQKYLMQAQVKMAETEKAKNVAQIDLKKDQRVQKRLLK